MVDVTSGSVGDCQACALRLHGFCSRLPAAEHAELARIARQVDYQANHNFREEDSTADFIGVVRTGFLRLIHPSMDGNRQVTAIIKPGEMVGETIGNRSAYMLETCTDTSICRFEQGAFARLLDRPPVLRRHVRESYVNRIDAMHRLTWTLGMLTPQERFCGFLLDAREMMPCEPQPDGTAMLTLTLPRPDIADLLVTTRETLSRLTHRLSAAGLIAILSPYRILLKDIHGLERMSGGMHKLGKPIRRPGLGALVRGRRDTSRRVASVARHSALGLAFLISRLVELPPAI